MRTRKTARRRAERVEARVTREQKRLLARAAALEGRSLTDFVLTSAEAAATETISRHQLLKLTPADQRLFVDALLNPLTPRDSLRRAVGRYRSTLGR